ncbi:MAG: hypothetical protein ACR2M8_12800 [Pyrinomonadaceae bacterium]|nr:hypothetical protein [Blastocatellia bacterium]MDQ3220171.1 hypothetical protein [Acidobacteriota bacterium]MDQ3490476.1 hypothetical protein [Acidobacteriota bacterium]
MQPNLTLKNGQTIPLMDETYEAILKIVRNGDSNIKPARSIEELEAEFSDLFSSTAITTDDLLQEHGEESERERRKLRIFD